jgi:hypothetical protein
MQKDETKLYELMYLDWKNPDQQMCFMWFY